MATSTKNKKKAPPRKRTKTVQLETTVEAEAEAPVKPKRKKVAPSAKKTSTKPKKKTATKSKETAPKTEEKKTAAKKATTGKKPARLSRGNSTVHNWVKKERPGETLYLVSDIADYIGKRPFTIRKWITSGYIEAPEQVKMGNIDVWLFTKDDAKRLKEFSKLMRPGRQTKEFRDQLIEAGKK